MGSNAKSGSAAKITLEKFDDLFGGSAAQGSGAEQIINAPLAELYTFKDHPFRVEDDEKMEETTESIRQYGVLVPGIARPRAGGGYEIIAGHRRKRGSELAGKTEMPVIVRNYTDDEATIIMVEANRIKKGTYNRKKRISPSHLHSVTISRTISFRSMSEKPSSPCISRAISPDFSSAVFIVF